MTDRRCSGCGLIPRIDDTAKHAEVCAEWRAAVAASPQHGVPWYVQERELDALWARIVTTVARID